MLKTKTRAGSAKRGSDIMKAIVGQALAVNDFVQLLGKNNDGQFVVNNDPNSQHVTLKRVNRGSFLTRLFYSRQDVSNIETNIRTRQALFDALRVRLGIEKNDEDAWNALRRDLGLTADATKGKPLNCRAVKQLFETKGIVDSRVKTKKAPTDKTITKEAAFMSKLAFGLDKPSADGRYQILPKIFRFELSAPVVRSEFEPSEVREFQHRWFESKLLDVFNQARKVVIGKEKFGDNEQLYGTKIGALYEAKRKAFSDLVDRCLVQNDDVSLQDVCDKATKFINEFKHAIADLILHTMEVKRYVSEGESPGLPKSVCGGKIALEMSSIDKEYEKLPRIFQSAPDFDVTSDYKAKTSDIKELKKSLDLQFKTMLSEANKYLCGEDLGMIEKNRPDFIEKCKEQIEDKKRRFHTAIALCPKLPTVALMEIYTFGLDELRKSIADFLLEVALGKEPNEHKEHIEQSDVASEKIDDSGKEDIYEAFKKYVHNPKIIGSAKIDDFKNIYDVKDEDLYKAHKKYMQKQTINSEKEKIYEKHMHEQKIIGEVVDLEFDRHPLEGGAEPKIETTQNRIKEKEKEIIGEKDLEADQILTKSQKMKFINENENEIIE